MSDLISKQRAIEAIDRFIPADPMMSDYTQGISVGLAIATLCIERFSQKNAESSQGLVKDLISRQDAIKAVEEERFPVDSDYAEGFIAALDKVGWILKEWLPSAEPKTPSNGSITSMNTEKMHDRTTDDCISRQDAKDAIDMALDHIDHVPPWVYDKLLNALNEVPSAEKAQLSGEDATSVCKCPCEYREPCDVCHYDGHRGHGCPAEEGKKAAEADEHAI